MNDTFGRELKEGQLVALAGSSTATPFLSVGRVVGPCSTGDGIRVRIFHSNSLAFQRGHRKWRGEVVREPGTSYIARFQQPDRILILHPECVPPDVLAKELQP